MKRLVALLALSAPASADPTCVVEHKPPPAVGTPLVDTAPCHRATKALEATLTPAILKRFNPTTTGGKGVVTYDCDGLGPTIAEIVVETGGGHGGSLGLWRALRRSDGRYDVRGIAYQGNAMTAKAKTPPYELATGVVDLPQLDAARAATTAVIGERIPPPPKHGGWSILDSWSSHDFHVLIRLVDTDGRVVEKQYTGYEAGREQKQFLGLWVAQTALEPIWSLPTKPDAATADDRALFADRFEAAAWHFDDQFYWWVMERYVDAARFLGTPRTLRGLLTRMMVADGANRSKVDARADAVEAIANITGWDARAGGKSVVEAAALYAATCR